MRPCLKKKSKKMYVRKELHPRAIVVVESHVEDQSLVGNLIPCKFLRTVPHPGKC